MNWLSWTLMVLAFIDPKIKATTDELRLVELARGMGKRSFKQVAAPTTHPPATPAR